MVAEASGRAVDLLTTGKADEITLNPADVGELTALKAIRAPSAMEQANIVVLVKKGLFKERNGGLLVLAIVVHQPDKGVIKPDDGAAL